MAQDNLQPFSGKLDEPGEGPWTSYSKPPKADGPWSQYSGLKPFDGELDGAAPKRTLAGTAGDLGVTALKGAVGLPQAAVGLLDIPTGGHAGKALEGAGVRFKDAQDTLDTMYSPAQQAANRKVREADGFVGTAKAMLENPSTIATGIGESLPQMIGGGGVARGLLAAAPKLGAVAAGALGEGVMGAGSAAEQIRGETADGLLTGKQAALAGASGAATAALGGLGGKVAQRLGVGDVDTMLASGAARAAGPGSTRSMPRQIAEGAVAEGVLEEMPQSMAEQALQNVALDKPVGEGVGAAAAQGLITGAAMGGVGGGIGASGNRAQQRAQEQATQAAEAPTQAPAGAETLDAAPPAMEPAAAQPDTPPGAQDQNEPGAPDAAPPTEGPVTPEQRIAQLEERLSFIQQQAKGNGWDQRLIAARDEATQELEALRGPAPEPAPEPVPDAAPQVPLSAQMGIDPTAGPLSRSAAIAVDSGASQQLQEAQFLGVTGRNLQARRTGPGITDDSNVIDVQGRVIEDRAIGTPRRLTATEGARESGAIAFREGVPRAEIAAIPNVVQRAQQLSGYDEAARQAQPQATPALPAPTNLREGLERIRQQRAEARRMAQPSSQPVQEQIRGTQAQEAIEAGARPAQAGAAQATALAVPGASAVRSAGALTDGAPAQDDGAQGTPAPGAQGTAPAPQAAVARPDGWRKSMLRAGPVAKALGIDTKGKRLAQVVAEIDAADARRAGVRQDGGTSLAALHEANGPYPPSAATRTPDGRWQPAVKTGQGGRPIDGAPTFGDASSAAAWAGYEQAKAQDGANVAGLRQLQEAIPGNQKTAGDADAATPRDLRLADERAPGAAAPAQDGAGRPDAGAAPAVGAGRRQGSGATKPGAAVRAAVPDAGGAGQQAAGVERLQEGRSSGAGAAEQDGPSATRPSARIEDFGEELKGARKMLYAEAYADGMAKGKALDTKAHPLSKTWPEPDYQKLLEGGAPVEAVSLARALREAVPTKPQSPWKLKGWATKVEALRGFAEDVLAGQMDTKTVEEAMQRAGSRDVANKAALYVAMGHERSLKGIDISEGRYSMYDRVEYNPPRTIWTVSREAKGSAFGNWPRELAKGDTREEAIAAFKKRAAELLTEDQAPANGATFEIYGKRAGGAREFFIGKKIGRKVAELKAGFADLKAAREYKAAHQSELEDLLAKYKAVPPVRNAQNAPRIGEDYRKGADVTTEQFQDAFGFRGVQFGNYVEGSRRQQDLNQAYDALMDLAAVLGLPPRALSLGGRLGLAFGARGTGGTDAAAAHYERGNVVINLTKREGAGSLAHEWWHGLDNYFSRQRGDGDRYMTSDSSSGDGVREEMRAAFREVISAINRTGMQERSRKLDDRRTKEYWTTKPEMSARAFESYVISKLQDQNAGNDYLANVVGDAMFALEGAYPYPTAGELPQIRAAFDGFFQTVETRQADSGETVLFSRSPTTQAAYEARIDALFAGEKPRAQGVRVLDRSDVLALLGLGEGPVHVVEGKVEQGRFSHGLSAQGWKKVPEWLESPAAVFDSDTSPGRLVFIAPELARGSPVRMIIDPRPDGNGVNLLINAYDAERNPFQRWEREGLLRYFDKQKAPAVTGSFQPRLAGLPGDRGRGKILTEKHLAGYRRANGPAFSFAGQQASTADRHALASAQQRLKAGEDAEAVRRDTGWHKGADGKWRFEISDANALLRADTSGSEGRRSIREMFPPYAYADSGGLTVGKMLHHPALFAAYPEVADMPVSFAADVLGDGIKGWFNTVSSAITLNGAAGWKDALSTLLHEIQHGIQTIEGFATGGSPDDKALLPHVRKFYLDNIDQFQGESHELVRMAKDRAYRNLAGEVEARNTQARHKLTNEQRRATPPSSTADVTDANVIVTFNGREMASAPAPANAFDFDAARRIVLGDAPSAAARRLSDERLVATQQLVDGLAERWSSAPEIIVARNMEDEVIPQHVRDYDAKLKSQGATGEPQGFILGGKVYLLADALQGPNHIATVLFHEVLGHYGLRRAFGDALSPILRQVAVMRGKDVRAKAREYGLDWSKEGDRLTAAEEVLAEMAQANPQLGFVQRAISAIRNWLRAHVPGFKSLRMTNQDIIQAFILPARGAVTRSSETTQQALGRALAAVRGDDAPMFSRSDRGDTPAAQRVGDALKSIVVPNLKQQAAFKATDLRPLGLPLLGRMQLVEVYGDLLPELRAYSRLMERMDADKNGAGAGADKLADDWAKLADERQLAELMHDATLAQMDPAKDYVAGDNRLKYSQLRRSFEALSPAARSVYTKARDTYSQHMADVRSAIKERIERSEMGSERKAAMLKRLDDEFFGSVKGVYFPLARFGQYVVVVKGAGGKVENVSRAETMAEADTLRRQLLTAFPQAKGFTVGKVLKAKDFVAERDSVGRGFMEQLYGVLDKQGMDAKQRAELEDALGQLYLSSLPDLSWAKHGIHRKGTPGFSQDARRAFAQNVFHGASYLAKLRYADQLQDQLAGMQRRVDAGSTDAAFDSVKAQQVLDEMAKRHDAAMNPKSNAVSTALTSLGFVFHLGLSPASAMVNLSQTALVAYPIMGAKWGFGRASAALLKASGEAARGRNDITASLSAEEKAAFDEAVRAGTIDVTMAHDLAGIAQGEDRAVSHKLRPVMQWASFMFHHAEKFNRQVTFVAAYRLARESGADAQAAYEQATDATYKGHFNYSANNRPRAMQGNVAKVLLLFKQYGQNMVYTLARSAHQSLKGATPQARAEARKALGGLLAMHAMAAGVLGLPMVTTLLAAASMLGGDDDEPWDAQVALQNMLADTFGQKPAEVLAHGLSRLTPWDVSGRVGLDRLIFPDVQEGLEGQRMAESAMAAALGPVAGIGINALKGLQLMGEGRYLRGLEAMAPSVVRGPLKALRYESEGARDKTGIVVQDEVDAAALWGQAAGFSPSDVRRSYEGKSAIVQHDRALQARRSALVEQFAMAAMAGDEAGKTEAREAIAKFNEKNPARRILPLNLMQSVAQRQKRIREAKEGVYLPAKRRDAMEQGRFALAQGAPV